MKMPELLSKKTGTHNIDIGYTQLNEIKEFINNLDPRKHHEKLKGPRCSLDDKINHVKRFNEKLF